MKKISLVFTLLLTVMLVFPAAAQDVASLDERVKRLTGYVQDLQEENQNQKRQIEALVKEVSALREQVATQPTKPTASHDDLSDLAKKVQEIERKREADRVFLEKEFDRLAKLVSSKPAPIRPPTDTAASLPKDALEHTVASGDTLLAIALAYSRETGKKITTDLIVKANPGLKPERLGVGQKILIPIPDK